MMPGVGASGSGPTGGAVASLRRATGESALWARILPRIGELERRRVVRRLGEVRETLGRDGAATVPDGGEHRAFARPGHDHFGDAADRRRDDRRRARGAGGAGGAGGPEEALEALELEAQETSRPIGFQPRSFAFFSLVTTTAAAPSLIWLALAAVMTPSSLKAVRSVRILSRSGGMRTPGIAPRNRRSASPRPAANRIIDW